MRVAFRLAHVLSTIPIMWGIVSPAAHGQQVVLSLPVEVPRENSEPVSSIAFSPDGKIVATGHGTNLGMLQDSSPGQSNLWDADSGKLIKKIPAFRDGVRSVTFSPDGKQLLVVEGPGIIRLIALPEGREIRKFDMKEENRAFYSVAYFPDGKQIVAGVSAQIGDDKCEVLILDVATGRRIKTLVGHLGPVASVAVSPDGKLVASGAYDGSARIWDAPSGKPLATLKFPQGKEVPGAKRTQEAIEMDQYLIWMHSVAFSPNGRTLACVAKASEFNDPAQVGLWDVSTAKLKASLKVVDPEVRQGVFSPDGRVLVTAGSDGATKLWNTATFKQVGAIKGCFPVAFSPDGKTIAATVDTRTVLIRKTPDIVGR